MSKATILFRHPMAKVRALPARPLEYRDPKGDTHIFMPETVQSASHGLQVQYVDLPMDFARRLLANQPDRYFLVLPKEIVVKRRVPSTLSMDYVRITNENAARFLSEEDQDVVAARAQKAEAERLERQKAARAEQDRKMREDQDAEDKRKKDDAERKEQEKLDKAKEDRRLAEDRDALAALQSADLSEAETSSDAIQTPPTGIPPTPPTEL